VSVLVVCTANVCRSPLAARLLTAELGPGVDVVSEHRSAAVGLVPVAQRKAFTLLQAARLAVWLAKHGVTAPAGLEPRERLAWWVDELDAARGDAPRADPADDDVPDPHDGGAPHEVVLPWLSDAAAVLGSVLR